MKRRLGFALAAALTAAGCAAAPMVPPPPPPPEVAAPAPLAVAPAPVELRAAFPAWHAGSVVQFNITAAAPTPPPGFGLYIYQLPGDLVPPATLAALENFNCADLMHAARGLPAAPATALMLLPVQTGGQRVDQALAAALLDDYVASPDMRKIYIIISSRPLRLTPGQRAEQDLDRIQLPFLAPPLVETWLIQLRDRIAQGDITTPHAFVYQLRSFFYYAGNERQLLGIAPAFADTPLPACQ
jgi:hypothetical protein